MRAPKKPEEPADDDFYLPAPDLPPDLDEVDDPELLQKDYYEERRQEEQRAGRLRRNFLITGIAFATVFVPLAFLRATGKLTRKTVQQVVTRATPPPRGIARPKPSFGNLPEKPLDAVAQDLQVYTNTSLPDLAPLENKAVFDFASVTGANFRGNEEGIRVIGKKVIPEFKDFLDAAEKVSPKTEEVREAHRIFMASERAKGRAYLLIFQGVSQKNNALIGKSQKEFAEANRQSSLFTARLKAISEKHGVLLQGF